MPKFKVALFQDSTGEGEEHQWWVAVGLNHWIATQARSREGVLDSFEKMVLGRAAWAKHRGIELVYPAAIPAKEEARVMKQNPEIIEVTVSVDQLRSAMHRETECN